MCTTEQEPQASFPSAVSVASPHSEQTFHELVHLCPMKGFVLALITCGGLEFLSRKMTEVVAHSSYEGDTDIVYSPVRPLSCPPTKNGVGRQKEKQTGGTSVCSQKQLTQERGNLNREEETGCQPI